MSTTEVERFVRDIETSPTLQASVRGNAADADALVAIARAQGYDITIDDVRAHLRAKKADLSDQELDAAIGGLAGMMGVSWGMAGFSKV